MMDKPVTPRGINHLVLNVRNLEESHKFWTEVVGMQQVGELKPAPNRPNPPRMRFYSGAGAAGTHHHDMALMENPNLPEPPAEWNMVGMTHSLYIHDPTGYGVELLYDLPREIWERDIDAALNFAVAVPTEGAEALVDRTADLPVFGATSTVAE